MAAATTRLEGKKGRGRVDTDGMADEEERQQEVQSWLASKPFHATGQGGRSTDGREGASAQPGLASPQLPGTNEQGVPETGGQSTVLWYSPWDGTVRCCTVSNV